MELQPESTRLASPPRLTVRELLADNADFVTVRGIPRQKNLYTPSQDQTADAFAFKWAKRDTFEKPHVAAFSREWMTGRYDNITDAELRGLIRGRKVLDAGCGAGMGALLLFGEMLKDCRYIGLDISTAVDVAAERFREKGIPGEFIQTSLTDIPSELGNFDVVWSEGVLHHTDSTERSFEYLANRLNPGGVFMFYVYARKAPVREYVDDMIRDRVASMSNEDAWDAMKSLTKLGIALGELNAEVEVPESVELLGIPAGRYNVQRLLYFYFFKAFYRPEYGFEEMLHINFDWYRPANAHRHTPEEVQGWLEKNSLRAERFVVRPEGISVIARRPS
jgi:SAM-dependent methyltransferase